MAKNKRNMLKLALKSRVANGISNWQRCLSKGLKNKEVWEKKKEGHTGKEKGLFLPEQALMKGGGGWSLCRGGGRCVPGRGILNAWQNSNQIPVRVPQ